MTSRETFDSLLARWAELSDLGKASALLSWDQETKMPPGGAEARGKQLATLAGLHHEQLVAPEVGDWISACIADEGEFDEVERAALREAAHEHTMATSLPGDLVREEAELQSVSIQVWRDARPRGDFTAFAPQLEKLVELSRRKAECFGYEDKPYDALLDLYERGATQKDISELFELLRRELSPLVAAVLERRDQVDASCLQGDFDLGAQAAFGDEVVAAMGFDFEAGRVDLSAHPFCSSMGHGDTRLTRRFDAHDLRPGLYGIMHEAGHGLYEQGLPDAWARHPLGGAVSLGIHESQSRLWENVIGRSLPFWEHFLPGLRGRFPGAFDGVTPEAIYRASNQVEASLIRVEADELTYNLHVILRFEVERRLFSGELSPRDLPAFWNDTLDELLGTRPPDDGDGCLQDIHWAMGAFGYFPTYTLGNLYASQLEEAARAVLPDLDDQVREGEFAPLREWLREKIHRHGKRALPAELIEQATGDKPSPDAFLRYIRRKAREVYGVT